MGAAGWTSSSSGTMIGRMEGHGLLAAGRSALAKGDWPAAFEAFQAAWDEHESADALDGVGLSLWWLGDAPAALDARSRAFALLRREQRDREAAIVGVWLARQYGGLFHRRAMAEGWLARTRSLVAGMANAGSLEGWLALVDSEATPLDGAIGDAERAVAAGRQHGDVDLEIVSLARLGACRVGTGEVIGGRRDLQQAMTAAVSGEGQNVQYVGEALCTLLEVAGWLGDPGMVEPWAQAFGRVPVRLRVRPAASPGEHVRRRPDLCLLHQLLWRGLPGDGTAGRS